MCVCVCVCVALTSPDSDPKSNRVPSLLAASDERVLLFLPVPIA